jgi:hypothetical protein
MSAGTSILSAGFPETTARQAISVQTCPSSRVVTLVLPHDISWAPAPDPPTVTASLTVPALLAGSAPGPASAVAQATQPSLQQLSEQLAPMKVADSPAGQRFLSDCAAALAATPRGKAALVLGGAALLTEGELTQLWRIGSRQHMHRRLAQLYKRSICSSCLLVFGNTCDPVQICCQS